MVGNLNLFNLLKADLYMNFQNAEESFALLKKQSKIEELIKIYEIKFLESDSSKQKFKLVRINFKFC